MDSVKDSEKRTEEVRAENEALAAVRDKEDLKKQIREAKRMYGPEWKKMIGGAVKGLGKLRVKGETLQSLHSLGIGGREMRNYNDPAYLARRK